MARKRSGHHYAFKFAAGYRSYYLGRIRFQTKKPRHAGLFAIHRRLACGQNRMWKAKSVFRFRSGARFPRETLDGNSATFSRLKVDLGFPDRAKAESAHHFLSMNWGWISQTSAVAVCIATRHFSLARQSRPPAQFRNSFRHEKRTPARTSFFKSTGGELGIRTPDALLGHTRLAGEHLRPLGQLSVTAHLV